ncbi:hypothetical protein C2G38_2213649 [Gigaspora rosea]|uniref:Uncharacterized protein n=1 Tax=Gigaspora rosea TaxID=44941 RepID=A0A397UFY7_9GLOM|nr:hypothetical protein C2G38_2213649 [Gigaspora rosea]CAG8707324.1 15145_t:CDS:1 [Gigaspora rosea]
MSKIQIQYMLALLFLFAMIKESVGGIIPQSDISPANPLLIKRYDGGNDEDEVCYDYIVATATFNDDNGLTGVMTLAGDDSKPITFIYGLFSEGIKDPDKFNVFIRCDDKIVYNLTDDLDLKFDGRGGTKPFCTYIHFDLLKFLSDDGCGCPDYYDIDDYLHDDDDDDKHDKHDDKNDKHDDKNDKHDDKNDKHKHRKRQGTGTPNVGSNPPDAAAPITQTIPRPS